MPISEPEVRVRPTFEAEGRSVQGSLGRLVLKDRSRWRLLQALPEDTVRIEAFVSRLSESERNDLALSLQVDVIGGGALFEAVAGDRGQMVFASENRGGRVVGIAAFRRLTDGESAAVTLAVDPNLRGRGLGALLLERLAVTAALDGTEDLIGLAHRSNTPLHRLFEGSGFGAGDGPSDEVVRYRLSARSFEPSLGRARGARSRFQTTASLRPLFRPRSVAVVGASRTPGSVGFRILESLVQARFEGPVYPVNPRASYVGSIAAWPSISALPGPVDLAVVAVPAKLVPEVVDECGRAGVRGLVVVTAGFAEIGGDGVVAQDALIAQVRGHGMRMVGPNCLGLLHTDPDIRLNASFAPRMPPHGSVALCSQSGALGVAIIALARRLEMGLSAFVSVGNTADISGNELIEYWETDQSTKVILLYLESFGDPRRFARIARRVGRSKPIVVVKAGRTSAGSRAASSHTAALSAVDTAVEALFLQTGTLRANTLQEMFGIARALTTQPLPPGRRAAIVTNAGGPAILVVDALVAAGLEVEPLSDETRTALGAFLPAEASTQNPVDMIASANPETYRLAVERVLRDPEVDALVVIYTPTGMDSIGDIARSIGDGVAAARAAGIVAKPVYASVVGADAEIYSLAAGDEVVPAYPFPEEIGRALGNVSAYAEWRRAEPGVFPELADQDLEAARSIAQRALDARGPGWLAIAEAREMMALAGLTLAPGGVATSLDEAIEHANAVGYPVAMTIASHEIVHKSDLGLVALDVASADEIAQQWSKMARQIEQLDATMQGVLVQPMISGGTEVMIGVDQDRVFGPMIAFGLGGVHVEILRDVAFRVAPLTDLDARSMVRQIRGYQLFEGYRGHSSADVPALEEALLRVSRLVEAVTEIREIDLNPIFALKPGEGYRVVDVRIRVEA